MKRILLTLGIIFLVQAGYACPVCDKQQPKLLKGISHGTGPESDWDFVIIGVMVIIVIFTLFFSIKWICKPGENEGDHIKNSILKFE